MTDSQVFITTQEATSMLGLPVERVRRMLRTGRLRGSRIGKTWLVLRQSVWQRLQETEAPGKPTAGRGKGEAGYAR